jgi:hypothetical protein
MIYTRKPETIYAFQLDFSDAEKTWETLRFLERMNYTLIHRMGDRYPTVRLVLDGVQEFGQGDYIYTNLDNYEWHGCFKHQFEEMWEA